MEEISTIDLCRERRGVVGEETDMVEISCCSGRGVRARVSEQLKNEMIRMLEILMAGWRQPGVSMAVEW